VVSSVALGTGAEAGKSLNVNADTAAACIAGALKAEKLILITDVPGIMEDPADPDTLKPELTLAQLDELTAKGSISGGMIPKTDCCREALAAGVETTHIIDGRVPHALLMEVFTDEGIGTMITK
jgi:acetylglutamate kinase